MVELTREREREFAELIDAVCFAASAAARKHGMHAPRSKAESAAAWLKKRAADRARARAQSEAARMARAGKR